MPGRPRPAPGLAGAVPAPAGAAGGGGGPPADPRAPGGGAPELADGPLPASLVKYIPSPSGATARPNRSPAPGSTSTRLATTCPPGVVSTTRPLLPLVVTTSPPGTTVSPSGSFSGPPEVSVIPPAPSALVRVSASGIAAIRFPSESETYSVPFVSRPTPVGPTTSALGSVCSANPVPITVLEITCGFESWPIDNTILTTVPSWTTAPLAATVPLSTLVTNRTARLLPSRTAVMSQGPLMSPPVIVPTTCPVALRIVSAPPPAAAELPPGAGRLPTTTKPSWRTASAGVSPTAGVAVGAGTTPKTCWLPCGEISTMLDPVPC